MVQKTRWPQLFLLLLGCSYSLLGCTPKTAPTQPFRLHLFNEPQQLDPAKARSSSASYFFNNTMRGLYKFDEDRGLLPEGGECRWQSKKKIICQIAKTHRWSDGQPVLSTDYIRSFHHLVAPETGAPRAQLLFSLKNSIEIQKGLLPPEKLGIKKVNSSSFTLHLTNSDPDFLMKLTSTALFPRRQSNATQVDDFKKFVTNGPYQVKSWRPGQWLDLTPNPYYIKGNPQRPPVRFYFIDSELTALRLYEQGELDFLRRFPSNLIKKFRHRPDFLQVPMARFDYIGFGPRLRKRRKLREALIKSLDYETFQVLLQALGRPGCPSLPKKWLDRQPCYKMNRIESQKIMAKSGPQIPRLQLGFSQLGGEDIRKQAEWLQSQWKKNLQIDFELRPAEQGTYLNQLRAKPMDVFRKGVGLDIPTCLNALKTFMPQSPQNFIRYENSKYVDLVGQLKQESDRSKKKVLCRKAVEVLMGDYWLIPLGEMYFSLLASPKFTGWRMNSLNQLDLSQLQLASPRKK